MATPSHHFTLLSHLLPASTRSNNCLQSPVHGLRTQGVKGTGQQAGESSKDGQRSTVGLINYTPLLHFYVTCYSFNSSTGCSQASLSTNILCHILRIASARKLVIPREPGFSHLAKQTSDLALSVKLSSSSHLHPRGSIGAGRSPAHAQEQSKLRRKQSVTNIASQSPAGGQQLPASATKEQALIAQLIITMIGARLPDKVSCGSFKFLNVMHCSSRTCADLCYCRHCQSSPPW